MTALKVSMFIILVLGVILYTDADVVAFTKGRMSEIHLDHGKILTFDKLITNISANFDSSGRFVCSIAGLYAFHFYGVAQNNAFILLELYKNNQSVVSLYGRTPNDYVDAGNSVLLNLVKNDVVYIKANDFLDTAIFGAVDKVYTTFTGVFLSGENTVDAFSVGLSQSVPLTVGDHVIYDQLITVSDQSAYNPTTGTFTARSPGIYIFHYYAVSPSNQELLLDLYHNDHYINSAFGNTPNEYADAGNTVIIQLHTGDKISVRSRFDSGVFSEKSSHQVYTTFSGSKLFPAKINSEINDIAFSVGLTSQHTQSQGHTVIFDKVFINNGSSFDTKSGKFTAKESGIYVFHYHALSLQDKAIWIDLYHNSIYINSIYGHVPYGHVTGSNTACLKLEKGDAVFLDIKSHDTALYGTTGNIYCTFSGYLLQSFSTYPAIVG